MPTRALHHRLEKHLTEKTRFLRNWARAPLDVGAVLPSGRKLAQKIASYVSPHEKGPVVELGPGTGAVTDALLRRGIAEERLVLIEFNPEFCLHLAKRFPKAKVIHGDAYAVAALVKDHGIEAPSAIVSSLPLFTRPEAQRTRLLREALSIMRPSAPFIQFTYAMVPPISHTAPDIQRRKSTRVWQNIPPARVWIYSQNAGEKS